MKYLIRSLKIIFFIFFSTVSFANEKIVFLDINKILKGSDAGKSATQLLETTHKLNNANLIKIEDELKKEEADIISKKNILSKEDYSNKIKNLRDKANKYRQNRSKIMKDLDAKRTLMTSNFLSQLKPIIADFSEKNSISMIIEKDNILMGKNNLDITDEILKIVNDKIGKIKLD